MYKYFAIQLQILLANGQNCMSFCYAIPNNFFPEGGNGLALWKASVTARYRARPQRARVRIIRLILLSSRGSPDPF